MDYASHSYLHFGSGFLFRRGFDIQHAASPVGAPTGDTTSKVHFDGQGGVCADEDLVTTTVYSASPADDFEQDLGVNLVADPAQLPILYFDGATAKLRLLPATDFCFDHNGGNTRPNWNELTGGAWQRTEVTSGRLVNYWVLLTNNPLSPVMLVMGQTEHSRLDAALDESPADLALADFPLQEWKFAYRLTIRARSSWGAATHRAKLQVVTDLRRETPTGTSGAGTQSHSALSGKSFDDSGHSGFQRATQISTSAPTANHDEDDTAGYGVEFVAGDLWLDIAAGRLYACRSAAAGSAVWSYATLT